MEERKSINDYWSDEKESICSEITIIMLLLRIIPQAWKFGDRVRLSLFIGHSESERLYDHETFEVKRTCTHNERAQRPSASPTTNRDRPIYISQICVSSLW